MKRIFLCVVCIGLLSGCGVSTQGQEINQQNTPIVDSEAPKKHPEVSKIIIQRGKEIFVSGVSPICDGLLENSMDLYTVAYRRDGKLIGTKDEKELPFLQESQPYLQGSLDEGESTQDHTYIRLVREPFIPEVGVNEFPRKDIVLFLEPTTPNAAFVGVQNPQKLKEWKIYQVEDYGVWLKKQIDLELNLSKGL
ncbi:hypothetical protein [Brevibacillus brevis]|uniref:hypothetical protein n=1 Tax=Brevibacillus brevis TaxID=1393 RepID=UPI00165DD355|nr:hypothetical protein [Brevibacillus brevis]